MRRLRNAIQQTDRQPLSDDEKHKEMTVAVVELILDIEREPEWTKKK